MKYLTYDIQGSTAFAKGYKMSYPSNKTIEELRLRGVHQIIWGNGDFLYI